MARRRTSLRESVRTAVHDYSLLLAAALLVLFGYALSQHVIPNYHELKELEHRRDELKRGVAAEKAENERLRDQISALDDPYYLAGELVTKYRWRYPPLSDEALQYETPAAGSIIPPPPRASETPRRRN